MSSPFKTEQAQQKYLARYTLRAKAWPVVSEERVVVRAEEVNRRVLAFLVSPSPCDAGRGSG